MGSSGKKKTTFAKLDRERKLRERRHDKQIKKDARKQASAERRENGGELVVSDDGQPVGSDTEQPALEGLAQAPVEE